MTSRMTPEGILRHDPAATSAPPGSTTVSAKTARNRKQKLTPSSLRRQQRRGFLPSDSSSSSNPAAAASPLAAFGAPPPLDESKPLGQQAPPAQQLAPLAAPSQSATAVCEVERAKAVATPATAAICLSALDRSVARQSPPIVQQAPNPQQLAPLAAPSQCSTMIRKEEHARAIAATAAAAAYLSALDRSAARPSPPLAHPPSLVQQTPSPQELSQPPQRQQQRPVGIATSRSVPIAPAAPSTHGRSPLDYVNLLPDTPRIHVAGPLAWFRQHHFVIATSHRIDAPTNTEPKPNSCRRRHPPPPPFPLSALFCLSPNLVPIRPSHSPHRRNCYKVSQQHLNASASCKYPIRLSLADTTCGPFSSSQPAVRIQPTSTGLLHMSWALLQTFSPSWYSIQRTKQRIEPSGLTPSFASCHSETVESASVDG